MNTSEIRINDKYAHLYISNYPDKQNAIKQDSTPIIKDKTIFTENFISRYINQLNVDRGMIPPNCRYMENVNNGSIIVIEEPPNIRTINLNLSLKHELYDLQKRGYLTKYGYEDLDEDKIQHKLTLAFPYVIFIFYINNNNVRIGGQVFLKTTPLFGLGDHLFKMPMLNISDTQHICFGDTINSSSGNSLLSIVQKSIMSFWSSIFNNDYIYNYEIYNKIPIINNYLEWEYMTKTNPTFIYDVDWILFNNNNIDVTKYRAITLGETIKHFKKQTYAQRSLNYNTLSDIFNDVSPVSTELNLDKIYNKCDLYYDIAQSVLLSSEIDNIFLQVGDSITMNNGNIGYVESFIGIKEVDSYPKFILIDLYGKKVHMKFTKKLKEFIKDKIIKERYKQTAVLKNDVVVKYGDILSIDNNYKQIQYIRKSRGTNKDVMEIKMENNYYLSNQIEGILLNKENFIINHLKFKQYDNCIMIDSLFNGANKVINKYKIMDLKMDPIISNGLLLCLKDIYSNELLYFDIYKINKNNFINEIDLRPLSNIFRIGSFIFKYSKEQVKDKLLYKGKNICLSNINKTHELLSPNDFNNMIKDNKFHIAGVDFDITFNIGDKVITSNWSDPMDVLNIKTIEKFEYNEESDELYFILKNKIGETIKHKYISNLNIINIGTVRKVTNKLNELYVGMKIKANETKIACFPKKDTNIIVAIIVDIDTQPLVLCSNGYTLFYSDVIEKFKLIDIKSKKWNKLKINPLDINKIKYQPGDIIKYSKNSDNRFLISVKYDVLRLVNIGINYSTNQSSSNLDYINYEDIILDCIPNPRLSKSQLNEKLIFSYYNFHGGSIEENNTTKLKFINY